MSISFSAYEMGRRALNANQLGINITGQNIANVNTPGYSRRHVQLVESAQQNAQGFTIGTGVTVAGVETFRNIFIQSRIQAETGIAGRLTAQRDALAPVETALQGSETGGLQSALNSFFGAFRDLEASPNSVPLRSLVALRGTGLANSFQMTRERLDEIRQTTDNQLRSTVDHVNDLSSQVASLNDQIRSTEAAGSEASSFRDQRTELVNKLAELTGARSTENSDGTVTLTIGEGRALVVGDQASTLTANNTPPLGLASIMIDGDPAVFTEGTIAGLQNAISETTAQIDDLDALAAAVVQRVNTLHESGTDLDGNAGTNFFNNAGPVTAANISINAAITGNPRLVVASPVTQPGQTGTVAGQIANLLTDPNTTAGTRTGSFSSIFGSMISDAGEKISSADNNLQTQAAVLAQAIAQRDAVSGVSLDEEAINLLQYQKAFEAASRFIRVADEMTQMILSLAQ
ncbi:MAG: flagellar hook-associated protein FlgK [Pyrinomonadaceae bacterium]